MDKLAEIEEKFKGLELFELLITAGVGLAVLLFGYRIKKIAFFIIWFLIGYNLLNFFTPAIMDLVPDLEANELFRILLPIGGGLLLALLGFSIEKLCVAGICFGLVMLITIQYFGTEIQTLAIGAVAGLIAGAAATALMKPAIILATSIAGGYALTLVILTVFPDISKEIFYFPMVGGISIVGALFQFATTKRVS